VYSSNDTANLAALEYHATLADSELDVVTGGLAVTDPTTIFGMSFVRIVYPRLHSGPRARPREVAHRSLNDAGCERRNASQVRSRSRGISTRKTRQDHARHYGARLGVASRPSCCSSLRRAYSFSSGYGRSGSGRPAASLGLRVTRFDNLTLPAAARRRYHLRPSEPSGTRGRTRDRGRGARAT
jgi:hypothetical protein